jgi:hypothetical protein
MFVGEPLTTAVSHVSVSLMADPFPSGGSAPTVHYIERKPDVGFDVVLTGRVEVDTPISYLVVEPVINRVDDDPSHRG